MPRDFYTWFPLDLPSLPSVRRVRREFGAPGVLMYYELRVMVASSYQYQQHVEVADVLAMAGDWDMDEGRAAECLRKLADLRLIDASMLAEGLIGIADVAERAEYISQKSEAGKAGGKRSGESRRKKAPGEAGA